MATNKGIKRVNGAKLKELRLQCGWTQKDLARHAGYSERVVRKAESSGSLKSCTLRDLADVFCSYGLSIKVEHLIFDQLHVAKLVVQSFDSWKRDTSDECASYLSNELEFNCVADCSKVPFAGTWKGPRAIQSFLNVFFSLFSRRPGTLTPIYLSTENRVVARFDEAVRFNDQALPKFFVNLHMHFDGLVVLRMDYECNFRSATDFNSIVDIRKPVHKLQ